MPILYKKLEVTVTVLLQKIHKMYMNMQITIKRSELRLTDFQMASGFFFRRLRSLLYLLMFSSSLSTARFLLGGREAKSCLHTGHL